MFIINIKLGNTAYIFMKNRYERIRINHPAIGKFGEHQINNESVTHMLLYVHSF